jgi:hypothetical protein
MNKNKLKILLVITFSGMAFSANALPLNNSFHCKDQEQGSNMQLDISINSETGEMSGFRGYVAGGCINTTKKATMICSVNEEVVNCECNNSIGVSILTMSRRTAILEIMTTLKDGKHSLDRYYCKKLTDKIF